LEERKRKKKKRGTEKAKKKGGKEGGGALYSFIRCRSLFREKEGKKKKDLPREKDAVYRKKGKEIMGSPLTRFRWSARSLISLGGGGKKKKE